MSERVNVLVIGFRKFSELVNALLPEFEAEANITLVESVASEQTDYTRLVARHQPDVIVSAGSNAAYLQATQNIPVVGQPVTPIDIIEAITRGLKISSNVHVFLYANALDGQDLARLWSAIDALQMGVQLSTYKTTGEASEKLLMALAKSDSPGVVVGPSYICSLAEQRDARAILLYSSSSARTMLRNAIDVATDHMADAASASDSSNIKAGVFVNESAEMNSVLKMAQNVARAPGSVLIYGESGTGKEYLARQIYEASDYSAGKFVPVNCGAIPIELFESELFGYVEGAFTGAKKGGKTGLIEQANGGVLFLDEIGEMPLLQQVKLLRVLQDRKVRPLGGAREIEVDFKLIAATNRDLSAAAKAGDFRQDLFYRINVFSLRIPPLRERRDEILPLMKQYLGFYTQLHGLIPMDHRVIEMLSDVLLAYSWPGNIRELQNFVERLIANSMDMPSQPAELRRFLLTVLPEIVQPTSDVVEGGAIRRNEQQAIEEAMRRFGNNKTQVASYLGISKSTLWRRLREMKPD